MDSTSTLPIIKDKLKGMKFELDRKVNYDPKQVISQRKESCRMRSFEHQNGEELEAKANVEYIEKDLEEDSSEKRKEKGTETQILVEPSSKKAFNICNRDGGRCSQQKGYVFCL